MTREVAKVIDPKATIEIVHDRPYITTSDGFTFSVSWEEEYDKDAFKRLNIYGSYHREKLADHKRYNESSPSISVSASRPVAAIAKDIERRFLAAYKTFITELRMRKQQSEDRNTRRVNAAKRLADLSGGVFQVVTKQEHSSAPHLPTDKLTTRYTANRSFSGDVEVGGDENTFKIELRSVPRELAERIMAVIAEVK